MNIGGDADCIAGRPEPGVSGESDEPIGRGLHSRVMTSRQERRQRILELISRNQIENQEQLQALLAVEGVTTTQATISRDLRDLGVTKSPWGYQVIRIDDAGRNEAKALRRTLKGDVVSIDRAASIVVIRTAPGLAKALAIQIDQARFPQCVGTIADDETIFIATRSTSQAGEFKRYLEQLAK